ncbi:DUF6192 family protein [Streptomyces massasporeus]|uniref:DUF6192 family protein n=1 Tax=Streptomyces massasporeus TaxID=67324 RepID=UPI0033C44CD2
MPRGGGHHAHEHEGRERSRARYEEIIAEDRKLIEVDTKIQFKIGDHTPRRTQDAARRQVGWRVDNPQTSQGKVEAIHDLAVDDQVAARVATHFLRRPSVAFRPPGMT